jgi:hypothetical protein
MAPMEYLGARVTMIHEKKPDFENLVSDSLKLLPARESLVSDIPAKDGKNDNLFYSLHSGSYVLRAKKATLIN